MCRTSASRSRVADGSDLSKNRLWHNPACLAAGKTLAKQAFRRKAYSRFFFLLYMPAGVLYLVQARLQNPLDSECLLAKAGEKNAGLRSLGTKAFPSSFLHRINGVKSFRLDNKLPHHRGQQTPPPES